MPPAAGAGATSPCHRWKGQGHGIGGKLRHSWHRRKGVLLAAPAAYPTPVAEPADTGQRNPASALDSGAQCRYGAGDVFDTKKAMQC